MAIQAQKLESKQVNERVEELIPINSFVEYKSEYKPSVFSTILGYKISRPSKEELVVEQKSKSGIISNTKDVSITVYMPTGVSIDKFRKFITLPRFAVKVRYLGDTSVSKIAGAEGGKMMDASSIQGTKEITLYFKHEDEAKHFYEAIKQVIDSFRVAKPANPTSAVKKEKTVETKAKVSKK